jgi:hypothetical protein
MKNKSIFKERKQLKKQTNPSDAGLKDNKIPDWTKPKHLSKKDRNDLKTVKKLFDKGKFQEALKYASDLDTIVREEIPVAIWKEIGGTLTRTGEEQLRKETNKAKHQHLEKFANRPDALNPKCIFLLTSTQLLIEALKKEFDIEYYVRKELANRGLDRDGKWVGFPKAKEIHGIE